MTQANGATKLARRAARWSAQAYARPTAGLRLLPDYLIIGAQRAGTTSLHRYLVQHPGVRTTLRTKGVHFFDTDYGRGMSWYASRFPTRLTAWYVARRARDRAAAPARPAPTTCSTPTCPDRVAEHLPQVKLIALLRDPVGRAYSHYQHEVARGFETLSFEEAIEAEPARLAGETRRMLAEPLYNSFAHQHHSYLARGRYHEQLERLAVAGSTTAQLLVLSSERFFAEPGRCFAAGARLPGAAGVHPRRLREAQRPRLPEDGRRGPRRRLVEHYREPNRRLYESLGDDFGWSA